jgi:hypothetical protein
MWQTESTRRVNAVAVIVLILLFLGTLLAIWELALFISIPLVSGFFFMAILSDTDIDPMPMLIPLFGPLLLRLCFRYIKKKRAQEKQLREQEKREREQWERNIDSRIDDIFKR